MTTNQELAGMQEFGPQLPSMDQVIEVIKLHGAEAKESKDTMSLWMTEQQELSDKSTNRYSRIEFNINLIKIYFESGLMKDANEVAYDTWDMINNEMPKEGESSSPEFSAVYDDLLELNIQITAAIENKQ
ncbi:MAG: hypothetical protein WCQ00_02880 [bacterium]